MNRVANGAARFLKRLSMARDLIANGGVKMEAELSARVFRAATGKWEDLGVVSRRLVTNAFVNFLVDQLQTESSLIGDFKYHDSGTGTTAESAGDTAMETPCGEARDSGTQVEGGSSNIYKTVATHTYAGSFAITEHGLFNASTSGTLMDRSVFSAINVTASDQIQFTYQLTCSSGG